MRKFPFYIPVFALAACATAPVLDAAHAIALAKKACRVLPHAALLTDWTANLHGVEWDVEGLPALRHIAGEGASVIVPVRGPAPTTCAGFYVKPEG